MPRRGSRLPQAYPPRTTSPGGAIERSRLQGDSFEPAWGCQILAGRSTWSGSCGTRVRDSRRTFRNDESRAESVDSEPQTVCQAVQRVAWTRVARIGLTERGSVRQATSARRRQVAPREDREGPGDRHNRDGCEDDEV